MRIKDLIPVYLTHLAVVGRSPRTIMNARYELKTFMRFLDGEGIHHLEELASRVVADYQEELSFRLTGKGRLLSLRSQVQMLGVVKGFTRFLKDKDYLLHDPSEKIKLPRKPKVLPKVILTRKEVMKILHAPDMRTNQ
jgi:integrase/recombinase XerD